MVIGFGAMSYIKAGNYTVKVMIGSGDRGEWFKLTDGKVTVKDVPFSIEKESISPDPFLQGARRSSTR